MAPADVTANYINVKTVDIDGVKDRVYEAVGSIDLDPAYAFEAVNAFTLPRGASISLG